MYFPEGIYKNIHSAINNKNLVPLYITLPLFLIIFLNKIGIIFGGYQFSLAHAILILMAFIALIKSDLIIDMTKLVFLSFTLAVIVTLQLFNLETFSFSALLLFGIVNFTYLTSQNNFKYKQVDTLKLYTKFMIICSVFGIAQFFLQFFIPLQYAFFLDFYIPDYLMVKGFNNMNALGYGIDTYKSNGFFLKEPSTFSQLLAIAMVIEVVYFKRIKVILLFLLAMAVTFSGTGLIILLLLIPFYLVSRKKFAVLFFLAITVLSFPFWANSVGLGTTYDRINEFGDKSSSAYARFISIVPTLSDTYHKEPSSFLVGKGAGSISYINENNNFDYEFHNPSWGKLVYEYGIIGFILYASFLFFCIYRSNKAFFIKASLIIMFLFLGEYVVNPSVHILLTTLVLWFSHESSKENITI